MATQTHPYLTITDGTTSCVLQDGSGGATNYPLVRNGWAPAIAGLRVSPLSGVSPYDDVTETLNIEINGASATAALANLETLVRLLEQASRWYRGEAVAVVQMKFAPQGSTVSSTAAPLLAAILDGSIGAGVKLSPRWDEVGRNYVIPDVQVSLKRRGLWLIGTPVTASDTENNGDLLDIDMGAAVNLPSPTYMTANAFGYGKSTGNWYHGGFVLIGEAVNSTAPIAVSNAEGAATGAYTSVAGGLNARNTNVLRYTPAVTTEVTSAALTPTLPTDTNLVAIFANVRPSATIAFTLRARLDSYLDNQYTPYVSIPANSNAYPYWVLLGIVPKTGAIAGLYLATTAASASSNLDIDSIVVCDARATQVLGIIGRTDTDLNGTVTLDILSVNHSLLDYPDPYVRMFSNPIAIPYTGDPVFMTKAQHVYAMLLVTGGGTSATGQEFRMANHSTDAVLSQVVTLGRRTAYLVPQ